MSKFTPGPWEWVHGMLRTKTAMGRNHSSIGWVVPTDSRIAIDPKYGDYKANARLIASAPELYEALLKITRMDSGLEAWHEDAMPDAMNKARHLLAKIDGEDQA